MITKVCRGSQGFKCNDVAGPSGARGQARGVWTMIKTAAKCLPFSLTVTERITDSMCTTECSNAMSTSPSAKHFFFFLWTLRQQERQGRVQENQLAEREEQTVSSQTSSYGPNQTRQSQHLIGATPVGVYQQ